MSTTPQDCRAPASGAPGAGTADQVEPQDLGETTEAPAGAEREELLVNPTDDLRTRKIVELRNKIASGDYEIDAEAIAKRIVDHI